MTHEFRNIISDEFSHLTSLYFNSAYFGPSPRRAKHLGYQAIEKEGNPSFVPLVEWKGIPDKVREHLALLLNCSPDCVSHHSSVSEVISLIACGFPFEKGDIVACVDGEYPSNVLPWMVNEKRYGYQFALLPSESIFDLENFVKLLPSKTRVLTVSHISFDKGFRIDLIKLGHLLKKRNIFMVVDGTQSLGGVRITSDELAAIDVFSVATYKWLLGPYGHAFAYFSPRAQDIVERTQGHWLASPNSASVETFLNYTTESLKGARKFDRGQSPNRLAMALLEGGLNLINQIGLEYIEKYNRSLKDCFLDSYPKNKYSLLVPKDSMGSIVCLKNLSGTSQALADLLMANGIDCSVRQGNLRLSFHFFNTENQIEVLVKTLDSV